MIRGAAPSIRRATLPKCSGGTGSGCVTESQATALKKIYGGVTRDGKPYFPASRSAPRRPACPRSATRSLRAAGTDG